ncbi:MAG: hypothetical protein M3O02_12915 [Acidobacteriota bacterium]|nr:hypothetical protein [Acidobacteriota bacterium]
MNPADYSLLAEFRKLFEGRPYLHRNSSQGDKAVRYLFEDLRRLNRSALLSQRIDAGARVVNTANKTVGISSRRGDGAFGELVPVAMAIAEPGFLVGRGPLSAIEIGAEAKILAKAMIKQIDRVISDLKRQVEEFQKNAYPICIAVVGVNHATEYTSFEGDRSFATDGKARFRHPSQEAPEAIRRLESAARSAFDEFLILRFSATNVAPFPFEWMDERETLLQSSALLARVSKLYDQRFGSSS